MATRMQQRRGTAAQWVSTNSGNGPILNAGEIGFETDTNKFKIGDGTNHWINLDYFIDANSTVNPAFGSSIVFEGATANAFETTVQVTDPTADRTITLPDATGTVVLADGSGNVTVSGDLTVSGTTTTINSTTINATTGIVFEGTTANDFETTLNVTDPTADRTLTLPNETGTIATQTYVTNEIGSHASDTTSIHGIADTAELATKAYADGAASSSLSTHTSDTTSVHGIADTAELATKTYADTAVSTHNSDTTNVHGIVDTSVLTTASNTQTLTGKTLTSPKINEDVAVTATATELNYVDGVTSAIQTQIDGKAASSHTHAQSDITNLTTDLAAKAALSGATFTGAVVLHADPATALGAATKQYVDSIAEGLHVHASVVAATSANITLATDVENGDTLDGVTLATGNRILVKNQSTASENGIYIVAASGAPSRAADFDSPSEIDGGDFVFVTGGTLYDNTGWVQTNIVGTIGTDAIAFSQFSGAGTITAGTNVSVAGNQVSVINNPTFSGLVTASASGVAFSDGTQTKEGVPSRTPIIQKTDSYTLSALTERDSLIEVAKATATTITIPLNSAVAFPVGTSIDILQTSTGQVTIAGDAGVTVNSTPGLKLRTQWSSATLFKREANTWVVYGDLTA